jgi:hypothetical protein
MKYNFLTHEEMSTVYSQRAQQGKSAELYTLDFEDNLQRLVFCGSRHTNDPDDKQFGEIEELWNTFLTLPGNKIAFCEGNIRPIEAKSREEAIRVHGVAVFLFWLARLVKVELVSPEPDKNLEVRALVKEFGPEKTILYYFDRQMYQWARIGFRHHGNVREYILSFLDRFPTEELKGLEVSPNILYDIFRRETGKTFSFLEIQTMYELMAPGRNEIASASSLFRNESIFHAITRYKNDNYSIFVVYGSGHAIVLEPALKALYAG